MEKREIVAALNEIGDYMELKGENTFKVRSFRNAARALEAVDESVQDRVQEGTLEEIPGIGKTLAEVIAELVHTGTSSRLEELKAEIPAGLIAMTRIPGLGPRKAMTLHEELGIDTVDDLAAACEDGRVAELSGFTEKSAKKILEGIEYRRTVAGRFLVHEAWAEAVPLLEHLRECPAVARIELAGSLRRRRETVKDIDIVASVRSPKRAGEVMERFLEWPRVTATVASGETKSSVRLGGGIQADLRVVDDASFPFALHYFTGSREHNTALRGLARAENMKLNEYGLFKVQGSKETAQRCKDEAAIFRKCGLDYIEPELREDIGEIELAREGKLPDLVSVDDLRGVAHVHTTYSDGKNTLEDMVLAAKDMGFRYLGVTDHSQSAGYAGGLKKKEILKQHAEIEKLAEKYSGFRIFKGIESDIRTDGSLDYPDDVLDLFDFIVVSIHSGFQLSEVGQTDRVIRALEDPHTTVLAHPTGRLLLQREAYAINMERVLEAAGELGVVVEINSHPRRLDLDWRWGRFARKHCVKTAIFPDAHTTRGLAHVEFGIGIARKAGFSAKEVVNTYTPKKFENFLAARKT